MKTKLGTTVTSPSRSIFGRLTPRAGLLAMVAGLPAMRRPPTSGATLQASCGKYVIAVNEDIDPDNSDSIFWAPVREASNPEDEVGDTKAGN